MQTSLSMKKHIWDLRRRFVVGDFVKVKTESGTTWGQVVETFPRSLIVKVDNPEYFAVSRNGQVIVTTDKICAARTAGGENWGNAKVEKSNGKLLANG